MYAGDPSRPVYYSSSSNMRAAHTYVYGYFFIKTIKVGASGFKYAHMSRENSGQMVSLNE
jgi:hypothetical protein